MSKALVFTVLTIILFSQISTRHFPRAYLKSADLGSDTRDLQAVNPPSTATIHVNINVRLNGVSRWVYGAIFTAIGIPVGFFGLKFWCWIGWVLGAVIGKLSFKLIK